MTESERKILNALTKHGSMTKREIAERLGLGWATVVNHNVLLEDCRTLGTDVPLESSGEDGVARLMTLTEWGRNAGAEESARFAFSSSFE